YMASPSSSSSSSSSSELPSHHRYSYAPGERSASMGHTSQGHGHGHGHGSQSDNMGMDTSMGLERASSMDVAMTPPSPQSTPQTPTKYRFDPIQDCIQRQREEATL
ncbi:hypothetical protein BGW38_010459, partial [Lunasporangiospora selenospora]